MEQQQNWHVYPLKACLILIQVQTGFHKFIGKVLTLILTVVLSYYKVKMKCYKSQTKLEIKPEHSYNVKKPAKKISAEHAHILSVTWT